MAVLLGCAAGPALAAAQSRDLRPVTPEMLAAPDAADWLSWRRTLDGQGYSPLAEVDRERVRDLQLVWSWGLQTGVNQTTPLVHDGVMYIANPGGVVHALDAATGDFIWEYRRAGDDAARPAQQMRSLALHADLVLLNTFDASVVALDARTGAVRWETPTAAEGTARSFTSGPVVADGVVVAGQGRCTGYDGDGCYVVGLDAATGRLLWKTSTIALPGEPGGGWGGVPMEERRGVDAWMTGSYDPGTRLVYWGTSQAKPWPRAARGTGGDPELYTNSTLALDPKTGEIVWFFQHIPADSHDMDEVFERVLVDHGGRKSSFSMGKLGILWELDRETGEFVRAVDLGYQNLVDVDPATGRVEYREGMLMDVDETIYMCPGLGGFKSIRAMAYHPATHALYIPLNLQCQTSSFNRGAGVSGRQSHFHPDSPDALGEIVALDVRSGERLWSRRRREPYLTSTLTTGGGLVFVGTWDRYLLAYDAETGEELWKSPRLPTQVNGAPITYAAGGRQYVAVVTGRGIPESSWVTFVPRDLLPDLRNPDGGNGVYVFALP